ncbi:MAG: phage major tail protein, TP901-1 family [Methylobacterium sp.]|jgi:TP901-1 family phage major tail protein|nr:phage major tail protein, TP901-1 family [Methylobacterium sp.]MCE2933151.1 phage major tail protein, TP901-1 family [Hyphomicrobiales bacterium]MCZ8270166.1 phage major tail protein, TP901-1 family [Beijerinckiaceae bacterium]MCA3640572.1 phage major tail protein, TP901-1 family [Methylobacterium sp.]MCA3645234.1 phage major tail protein, TP901-1 family [Methylobacterium sp.]
MAAQRGKDILLKLADSMNAFVTVAGLRTRRFSLNAETVDVTHSESAGRWRELLDGAGVRRASISGSGIFKDGASDELVRQVFFDGAIRNWKIVLPDFGEITGPFQITSLDYRGEHAAEMTFEMAMESAGALTFTAL